MGTRVDSQVSSFRASRASRRHLEDMADSLHRLPSAAEDLQVVIPRCNGTLLLQGEFCITLTDQLIALFAESGQKHVPAGLLPIAVCHLGRTRIGSFTATLL